MEDKAYWGLRNHLEVCTGAFLDSLGEVVCVAVSYPEVVLEGMHIMPTRQEWERIRIDSLLKEEEHEVPDHE